MDGIQMYPAVVLAGMQHSPIVPTGHWNEDTAVTTPARLSARTCVRCIFNSRIAEVQINFGWKLGKSEEKF
jgi:hypothetical protein